MNANIYRIDKVPEDRDFVDAQGLSTRSHLMTIYDHGNSLPMGIRQCNPGCIKSSSIQWQGLQDKFDWQDGRFCSFIHHIYGIRAIYRILMTYARRGKTSARKMIEAYAPPIENQTRSYIQFYQRRAALNADVNIIIPVPTGQALGRHFWPLMPVVDCITRMETGVEFQIQTHTLACYLAAKNA